MSENNKTDLYKETDDLLKRLNEYPNSKIEEGLADIHKRISEVKKYNSFSQEKEKPLFYRISNIEQVHTETSNSYFNFTQMNDLGTKVVILGKIDFLNKNLIDIEKKDENND